MPLRILLTGASSMSGMWFAIRLAEAGHAVTATFTRDSLDNYSGLRATRVAKCAPQVTPLLGCRFGDDRFLGAIGSGAFDVVCCHGADVTDYKSPDFDPIGAVANNAHRVQEVMLAAKDRAAVVLTGSVFEGGEGAGSEGLPHVSPYGMSKALTWEVFRYYAEREGVGLGKFVIPNPYGPYEEPRFTNYLIKTWRAGETAGVRTPRYVRDNVPISLLALAYVRFVEHTAGASRTVRHNPSGYVESQGAFTVRFAQEMRPRLDLPCEVELAEQVEFNEPRVRINTEPLDHAELGWDEAAAWDEVADYYQGSLVPS